VSKFIQNLHVEILKVLPNSEIYLNSKIKALAAAPTHSIPGCRLPHPAQQARVMHWHPV
jgi:hypothetical protein